MITIRPAAREDAETLFTLLDALADYEKLGRPTAEARERLLHDAFDRTPPRFYAVLAEHEGKAVGYSLFFETYSSFLAKPTLYAEDIFVLPDTRRLGVGNAIFQFLVAEAHRRGCGRMEWACLDWNQLAIGFYDKRGAHHLDDWRSYRLTEDAIAAIVSKNPSTT